MLPFTKVLGILPGPHGLNSNIVGILRGLGTKDQGDTEGLKVRGGPPQGYLCLLQVFGDTRVARLNKMGHTKERSLGSMNRGCQASCLISSEATPQPREKLVRPPVLSLEF